MSLVPDRSQIGVWSAAPPTTGGVHALVVGVSEYPYLLKGSAPPNERAPDPGGLGQLEVSALTAARVFEWLNSVGEVAGAPLASCRLLLAPRPGEKIEVDRITQSWYGRPDFASCRTAIEAWGDELYAAASGPNANVAFFFFSGHGVEYLGSPALLMMDVLNPRSAGGANKAVAFLQMLQAVKTFGIDRGLCFVDACRDASRLAKTLNIVGDSILKPSPLDPLKSPDALISLQATRYGLKAYQVKGHTATIFGQAVLEALDGPPPSYLPYDTSVSPWRLLFKNLESHVKQRVRELLKRVAALEIQPAEPYGNPYNGDMLVAEKRGPRVESGRPGVLPPMEPPPSAGPSLENLIAERSSELLKGTTRFVAADAATMRPPVVEYARNDLADFSIMHRIFRHEAVTDPWIKTLKILDTESEEPVSPNVVSLSEARSEEVGDNVAAWIDVKVAPGAGKAVWISAGGDHGEPSFSVVIARDLHFPVPVRLDVSYRRGEHHAWNLSDMSARLAEPLGLPSDVSAVWNSLWRMQRLEILSDLGNAGIAAAEFLELEMALLEKATSPLAAAIASTVLIRSGATERLHDWPRNLSEWFEWLPDGPVLWAETLLRRFESDRALRPVARRSGVSMARRQAQDEATWVSKLAAEPVYQKARGYFAETGRRGAPLLAPSITIAASRLPFWRRVLETKSVSGADYYALQDACGIVERAAEYAVSGGLFAGFVAVDRQLTPAEVLGSRRRAAARAATAA